MKKILIAAAMLFIGAAACHADGGEEGVYEVGYSTFAVVAVQVTSGTAVQINATRPVGWGANVAKYRVVNSHPSWDIYVGDVNVSTDVFNSHLGEIIAHNGGKAEYQLYKDYARSGSPNVPIYAKAADSSAVDRLPRLSVFWFGY